MCSLPIGDAGDGRSFIESAIEQGAALIVLDPAGFTWNDKWAVPYLTVESLKANAGAIAHAFYQPGCAMFTVGVTGTNGKTSSAVWLGQALSRAGEPAAVIGTLGVGVFRPRGGGEYDVTGYTTPDAVLLARNLADLRDQGVWRWCRPSAGARPCAGMHFDVALFTNLTRDHLDYHGDGSLRGGQARCSTGRPENCRRQSGRPGRPAPDRAPESQRRWPRHPLIGYHCGRSCRRTSTAC
jgi:UDP-N-acetylmuramoyl-L-alanyl-D-glutamate--2,6-diaminopimelate ligase